MMFCFMSLAIAQKPKVLIVDPEIDANPFKKDYDVETATKSYSHLPNKKQRDACLLGLKQANNWDELDKDIFYKRLKSRSLADLKHKYSSFSDQELKELSEKCP